MNTKLNILRIRRVKEKCRLEIRIVGIHTTYWFVIIHTGKTAKSKEQAFLRLVFSFQMITKDL
jgi:hypothetical protein